MHIEQMLADLRTADVGARGRQMAVNVLSAALKHATRMRPPLIQYNPVASVVKPRPQKPEFRPFTPGQVGKFFVQARADRSYALYVMAIDTGMREGEIFALERDDVDFTAAVVMVRRALKNSRGRSGSRTSRPRRVGGESTWPPPRWVPCTTTASVRWPRGIKRGSRKDESDPGPANAQAVGQAIVEIGRILVVKQPLPRHAIKKEKSRK
jgi:integrase